MSQTGFERAFDSVAGVVEQAATIPDHRERPVTSPILTHASNRGEVEVTVSDAKVQSMRLDENWWLETPADDAADLISKVTNEALEEWSALHLETIQNLTPDMKQLHAAIDASRRQLEDAWVATLADSRTP